MSCESNSDKENIGYIYAIINEINGKVYIGQTKDIKKRLNNHRSTLKNNAHKNPHLQKSVNKYGIKNFTFEPLFEVPTEELDVNERFYIAFFESMNPKKGYNKENGGNQNKNVSEETRRKMSKASKERWKDEGYRKKMSEKKKGENHPFFSKKRPKHSERMNGKNNPNWGKKTPEETRRKISKTLSERCNITGFYRVSKDKDNACKQGFLWRYKYCENGKQKSIKSVNLSKLQEKVKKYNLPWEILDEEKAKKSLEENNKYHQNVKK